MKFITRSVCALAAMSAMTTPELAYAEYNANIQGVITSIRVYDDGRVLLRLENQPTTHPVCNSNYFAIDNATDPDIRAMFLSRALVAKSSGETVNFGYDNAGNCANGYIRIHEIGW